MIKLALFTRTKSDGELQVQKFASKSYKKSGRDLVEFVDLLYSTINSKKEVISKAEIKRSLRNEFSTLNILYLRDLNLEIKLVECEEFY